MRQFYKPAGGTIYRAYNVELAPIGVGNLMLMRLVGLWHYSFVHRFLVAPTSAGAPAVSTEAMTSGAAMQTALAIPLGLRITLWSAGAAGGVTGAAIRELKASQANPNVPNGLEPMWYQWFNGMVDFGAIATDGVRFTVSVAAFTAGRVRSEWHLNPMSTDCRIEDSAPTL